MVSYKLLINVWNKYYHQLTLTSLASFLMLIPTKTYSVENKISTKSEMEACPLPEATPNHPTGYVTGAGPHFSWTIFDSLKRDLEHLSGRKILFYSKDSMLGQGCNADTAKKTTK